MNHPASRCFGTKLSMMCNFSARPDPGMKACPKRRGMLIFPGYDPRLSVHLCSPCQRASSNEHGLEKRLERLQLDGPGPYSVMKKVCLFWLITFSAFLSASAADAKLKPSGENVKKELTDVIESQLAAFRQEDYAKAYSFAAAGIQKQFSRAAFEKMVKNDYPVIANSKSVRFGLITDNGKEAVVVANVRGNGKQLAQYQYLLVFQDSKWRINGVHEVKAKGTIA
jgi:hypothetical protein